MNLNGRLDKLEQEYAPAAAPELEGLPFDFLDREAARWDGLLDLALETVDDEEAVRLAEEAVLVQFRKLRGLVEPGEFEDQRAARITSGASAGGSGPYAAGRRRWPCSSSACPRKCGCPRSGPA
jgi:hypothetical protein